MIHRKVQCWILLKPPAGTPFDPLKDGLCLLLKTNVVRGSFWQPVTGTVEVNEGYFEAACREPLEETGFHFPSAPIDTGYEFDFTSRQGHTRERIFVLSVEEKTPPKIDPKEHQDFQWIAPKEALKLLKYPSNIDGLKQSFKLLFNKELT